MDDHIHATLTFAQKNPDLRSIHGFRHLPYHHIPLSKRHVRALFVVCTPSYPRDDEYRRA